MDAKLAVLLVALLCNFAAHNSDVIRKLRRSSSGPSGAGHCDIPQLTTVKKIWNYCREESKDGREAVEDLDLDLFWSTGDCLIGVEYDSTLLVKSIIQDAVADLPRKKKEIILDCLIEKNLPLGALSKEPEIWSNKFEKLFSSWDSVPSRYLRHKMRRHQISETTRSPAPALSPRTAPSVAPALSPGTASSVAPALSPGTAPSVAPAVSPGTAPSVAPAVSPGTAPSLAPAILSDYFSMAPMHEVPAPLPHLEPAASRHRASKTASSPVPASPSDSVAPTPRYDEVPTPSTYSNSHASLKQSLAPAPPFPSDTDSPKNDDSPGHLFFNIAVFTAKIRFRFCTKFASWWGKEY